MFVVNHVAVLSRYMAPNYASTTTVLTLPDCFSTFIKGASAPARLTLKKFKNAVFAFVIVIFGNSSYWSDSNHLPRVDLTLEKTVLICCCFSRVKEYLVLVRAS